MSNIHDYSVRLMNENDLLMVLEWRNHPDVRRFMYTKHDITLIEHTAWFERESINENKSLLVFEDNSVGRGFINFTRTSPSIVEWGFYLAPDAPKGTGKYMGKTALNYAFSTLGIHKIMGYVVALNNTSIRFHERLGFLQEGLFREQYFDGAQYQSVVCFGLLKNDWLNFNWDDYYAK